MNQLVNKFLLTGDKFMPEMHLKQPGFTYSICGTFTENKERTENFIQAEITDYIYKNDLDKACFQHDKAFKIANNINMIVVKENQIQWYTSFK